MDTEEFQPYTHLASQLSCFMWLVYCTVADETSSRFLIRCIVFCGIIGLTFESVYFPLFSSYCTRRNQTIMKFTGLVGFVLLCSFAWFYVQLVKTNSEANTKLAANPSFIIGSIATAVGTLMNSSPLYDIINVYQTKSLEYTSFSRCVAMLFNSLSWFIFATMTKSFGPYVSITNGIGTLLGLLQFGILHKFQSRFPKSRSVVVKRLEAKLNVDPTGQYMVFSRVCPRHHILMFEHEEKIKFDPSARYVLYQCQGSKSWRVNAVETTPDTLERCKALPAYWQRLSEESIVSRKTRNEFCAKCQIRGSLLPTTKYKHLAYYSYNDVLDAFL